MTASPTPEQSARAILRIFKSQNCIAGDPLRIDFIKAQFLKNHGSEADYTAGLLYAEDSDWVEVSPAPRHASARHAQINSRWLCKNIKLLGAIAPCRRTVR